MKRKLLKAKTAGAVFAFFAAWLLFSACGSDAEDEALNEKAPLDGGTAIHEEAASEAERDEAAEGIGTEETEAERDDTGTEEESLQHSGAEEIRENMEYSKERISLTDVAWEDFYDGLDSPVIHFTFSNGTVADKELSHMSIVKNVEYRDITGDGSEEAVIYREFVSNTYDDYILMDFFEIEDDTVTEISPSRDIPELSDTPWDTEIMEDHAEGYTIVLKMESCGKIAGVLYTEAVMTVGYGKEGWVLIQHQEIPDWKIAYLDHVVAAGSGDAGWFYWLEDIDGDGIPELFYYDNAQLNGITCKNGIVQELGEEMLHGEGYEDGMRFDELWMILGSAGK